MTEGKVNSKYQLTLPAEVRKALGVKPGDRVRYDVQGGKLSVSVVRPDIESVLDYILANYDLSALQEEIGGDAAAYVRKQRGWEDNKRRQQRNLFSAGPTRGQSRCS